MTPRITALDDTAVPAESARILSRVGQALGMVPNLHRTLAHAPAALKAYTDMAGALAGGVLEPRLREQIAVATAGLNGCAYCASAHTALGRNLDLGAGELAENLAGRSSDPRTGALLVFVRALVERRGDVTDADLGALREAGFTEAEIVETVTHVGLNVFTNVFNVLARTEIDFPRVELAAAAS